MTKDEWYLHRAMTSLNQTIGRVIRHSRDFGLVVLLDNRLSSSRLNSRLSNWIQPFLEMHRDGEDVLPEIADFFEGKAKDARKKHAREVRPREPESQSKAFGNILSEARPFADDLFQLKTSLGLQDEFESTLGIIRKIDDKFFESKFASCASEVTLAVGSRSPEEPPRICYSFESACGKCRLGKLEGARDKSFSRNSAFVVRAGLAPTSKWTRESRVDNRTFWRLSAMGAFPSSR